MALRPALLGSPFGNAVRAGIAACAVCAAASAMLRGGDCRRSVCLEYLFFNDDGTIRPVVQTEAGVSVPPPAVAR